MWLGRCSVVPAAGIVALTGLVAGVSACSSAGLQSANTVAFSFGPNLRGDLHLPPEPMSAHTPLVVLVPGGGWTSADPTGLVPLADRFAASGMASATVTYRVGAGARFPVPVADILCAVDSAAQQTRSHGTTPDPIVVLGHSAGAQLAALAMLTGSRYRASCPAAAAPIDAIIGLAGPYDISRFAALAQPLLGTSLAADPAAWRAANPLTWVAQRPQVPALLAAGAADELVPLSSTNDFATALRAAGHQVQVQIVDGATHASIYRPEVIAASIVSWINTLSPTPATGR